MTQEVLQGILRTLRLRAKLSKRELSSRLGYSAGWAGKIESGKLGIQIEDISKWATACGFELRMEFADPEAEQAAVAAPHIRLKRLLPDLNNKERQSVDGLLHLLEVVVDYRRDLLEYDRQAGRRGFLEHQLPERRRHPSTSAAYSMTAGMNTASHVGSDVMAEPLEPSRRKQPDHRLIEQLRALLPNMNENDKRSIALLLSAHERELAQEREEVG